MLTNYMSHAVPSDDFIDDRRKFCHKNIGPITFV
jgi:hypothetical protein